MNKVYKIVLLVLIIFTSVYFTYEHYTDPVYQLKVGTILNRDDKKIENWGGRFQDTEANIYIGYRTRLDSGTEVKIDIEKENSILFETWHSSIIQDDKDFYYTQLQTSTLTPGRYIVTVSIDEEIIETTSFIWESTEE